MKCNYTVNYILGINYIFLWCLRKDQCNPSSVGGIAVSIASFQAVDPGSTHGLCNHFLWKSVKVIIEISG